MESCIGDYQLLEKLGEGSLGSTYLAEQRFFKQSSILKVLSTDITQDSHFQIRLEREVQQISRISHQNLRKILYISKDAEQYFFVYDTSYTDPQKVKSAKVLARQGFFASDEQRFTKLVMQMASALDALHAEGIVHGNLKASNLLILEESAPRAIFLDYGLAKLMKPQVMLKRNVLAVCNSLTEESIDTIQASFLQGYYSLAPEVKQGEEISPQSDLYSWGMMLYELIMNQYPEGFLTLPSSKFPLWQLNWDLFFYHLLQNQSSLRPKKAMLAIEKYLFAKESEASLTIYKAAPQAKKVLETPVLEEAPIKEVSEIYMPSAVAAIASSARTTPKPIFQPSELKRPEYEPDPGKIFQMETTVARYQPTKQQIVSMQPILTEMVIIPPGAYQRGSKDGARDEKPRHTIELSAFAIDIHPVTNEQFVRFLEVMGGEKDAQNSDIIRLRDSRIKRAAGKLIIESGYAKHPVVGVTWYGAIAYAKWVGKRIPTEAEWEIASAGGIEEALYPTGLNIERTQANFFSADTTAVCSYPPNGYGIYDMAGNVYEWCQDWYSYNYYEVSIQEPLDPKGPQQGVYRVLRGGCWKSLKEDLRCAHRHRNNPGTMTPTYGFRCVADVAFEA